jgi:hypothetical protein
MLPLPSAYVGLIGALHESFEEKKNATSSRRRASIDEGLRVTSGSLVHRQMCRACERQAARLSQTGTLGVARSDTNPQVWKGVWAIR